MSQNTARHLVNWLHAWPASSQATSGGEPGLPPAAARRPALGRDL